MINSAIKQANAINLKDDLISRQAALKVTSRECHELRGVYADIERAINDLPSADKWIPVTERLPEDGERVLITYDGEGVRGFVKLVTYDEMRGRFYDSHAIALDQDCITAWMPLPKPYKSESEDKE